MAKKSLVLPLSYNNIGDIGGLRTGEFKVHPPVRPIPYEEFVQDLTENLPRKHKFPRDLAIALEKSGKHCGLELLDDGRCVKWRGRWGVDACVTIDDYSTLPKGTWVSLAEVRKALHLWQAGYHDLTPAIHLLAQIPTTRYQIFTPNHIVAYNTTHRTVLEIRVSHHVAKLPSIEAQ